MEETWVPIPEFEGLYEASTLGRIRSLPRIDNRGGPRRGRVLKPQPCGRRGHRAVSLSKNGVVTYDAVHRIIMRAFVGPRPAGMETRHLNGDPADNRLVNLKYGTPSENALDRVRHGTHPMASKTHCKRGHAFTKANTYIIPTTGSRQCKTCKLDLAKAKA
jgi:hypothetical protein